MFQVGEYVVCGNKGVCLVKEIMTLQMGGADKNRLYYVLKPVYAETATVYIPVDSEHTSLRRTISGEQASLLLNAIPGMQPIAIRDEKLAEDTLCGELAVALGISRAQAEADVADRLAKQEA